MNPGELRPPPSELTRHEDVPGWAIRLEAKVDIALAQHGSRLDSHDAQIEELRRNAREILDKKENSHHAIESRLLTLERQPTVTPRQLGASALGIVSLVTALVPIMDRIYN